MEVEDIRGDGAAFITLDSELNVVIALQDHNPENINIEDLQNKYIIKKISNSQWQKAANNSSIFKFSGCIIGLLSSGGDTLIVEHSLPSILIHNFTHDN